MPASGRESKHPVLIETFDPMIAAETAAHLIHLNYWSVESSSSAAKSELFGVAETASVLSLSYDFLLLERLMRTFRGLPLVAATSDAISSTEATAGTFRSTSMTFMGLRRKTRIKGASI